MPGFRTDPEWGKVGFERPLREILGKDAARKWLRHPVEELLPRSLSAAASLKQIRLLQLQSLPQQGIDDILQSIRGARIVPKLNYHFGQHGRDFGALTPDEYVQKFLEHLQRADPRVFAFVRSEKDLRPFWTLVAPDTGATVLYNERDGKVWSFYRPGDTDKRMATVQPIWLEVVRRGGNWAFEENWVWKP